MPRTGVRRLVRLGATVAGAAAVVSGVCVLTPGRASSAVITQYPPFIVGQIPPHPTAAIFNNFADVQADVSTMGTLQGYLQNEGYAVSSFAGGETLGAGTATLPNFLSMAGNGVVIIDSHGFRPDASPSQHQCPGRKYKGIYPIPGPPGSKKQKVPEATTCLLTKEEESWFKLQAHIPYMQVEWYAMGPNSLQQALDQYRTYTQIDGYPASDLRLIDPGAGPSVPPQSKYGPFVLAISPTGLAHYFGAHQMGIVDAIVCHSLYFASSFSALSYFGYKQVTCSPEDLGDQLKLWGRLVGLQGVGLRDTLSAQNAGGFSEAPCPCLAPGFSPVVLSPAVAAENSTQTNPGSDSSPTTVDIFFDAFMNTSDAGAAQVVSQNTGGAGCGSVSPATWVNPIDLQFTFTPNPPNLNGAGRVSVTLPAIAFEAQPGGSTNSELDGNQNPANTNGVLPNGDDWVQSGTLSCNTFQSGGGG